MKNSLVIRNCSQLSKDEINDLFRLAGLEREISSRPGEHSLIAQLKEFITEEDTVGIRDTLKSPIVRDYLSQQIKVRNGYDVVLHLNEDEEDSVEHDYLINKIRALSDSTCYHFFFIGGGHGGYIGLGAAKVLSGLKAETVYELIEELKNKQITFDGGVFHSCSSALFVNHFRKLLTEQGVMLSYCAELGASSNWNMAVAWLLDEGEQPFFSSEALMLPWIAGDLKATTSVISTKYTNTVMDLEHVDADLPDYILQTEDTAFQRQMIFEVIQDTDALQTDKVHTYVEIILDTFNDVIAMERFNEYFSEALQEHAHLEHQSSAASHTFGNK